jgi:flagellar basal body-associated protein FliL
MAEEKKEKAPEAPKGEDKKKKGGGLPVKMLGVALAVVMLEVTTVVGTMMMAGGPKKAVAEVPVAAPKEDVEKDVEVPIIEAKLPNNQTGRLFLYDLNVVAKVGEKQKTKVEELLKERQAEVKDRIRTIIASSDPKSLSEPGLETLRRQLGYQLEQDLGHDLIKELLIPKCTPFRAEF